jgi:histidinol-phosphate phosphatase family protein
VTTFDLVIPTVGRPSLALLLRSIAREGIPQGTHVLVVDDRPSPAPPLGLPAWVQMLRGPGRGPASARNRGWRASDADWAVFLDDDTLLTRGWFDDLREDLAVDDSIAGSQGRIVVPRPLGRRPTDAERAVIGLEGARFATADMAYRRRVLSQVGGFDVRFPRPYREDADIALRVMDAGHKIVRGRRRTLHPLADDRARTALRRQAGNRDDVLMRVLHGRRWRVRAGAPAGRLRRHAAITAAGLAALLAAVGDRRRLAAACTAVWAVGTLELAYVRIAAGPRTLGEVGRLLATSVAIPPVAVGQWLIGVLELPGRLRHRPRAVLLDRDGTLIVDVPYNGDPARVRPMPGAAEALGRLRRERIATAIVTNQSAVGRGLITTRQLHAVNRRVEQELGPLGPWLICPHDEGDGCGCRKPAAGLMIAAARALGVRPSQCAMIGDTAADMEAARAAGVRGVLVPTPVTRRQEVAMAGEVAGCLSEAVELLLGRPS